MKKSIVLVKIEDTNDFYIPFGILYLANALKQNGFEIRLCHIHQSNLSILYDMAKEINPLFVGFSTKTSGLLLPTIKASKIIKALNIPVVWGGIHATILPEMCLKEGYVDYVIKNEGEETIVELAFFLNDGISRLKESIDIGLSQIKGLVYRKDGKIVINSERPFIRNLDKYTPAWEMIDLMKYYKSSFSQKRILPLITSRGCPYKCGFCYNLIVNHSKWRAHSAEFVLDTIKFFKKKYLIDGIIFHDDNFFTDKKRGKKILKEVDVPFSVEIRADYLSRDFLHWLSKTQCKRVFIGVESGSQGVLDKIGKKLKLCQIEEAVDGLKKIKIDTDLSFIIGFPEETDEDRRKTLDFIDGLKTINPKVNVSLKIYTPYPGTPLWEIALKNGFKQPQSNEEWSQIRRFRCALPWIDIMKAETIAKVSAYALTSFPDSYYPGHFLLHPIEKFRWNKRIFRFPLEFMAINFFRKVVL